MKLLEWLVLAIVTRFLSRPQQIMFIPPPETKPERSDTSEMFRIGTTEYEIFCTHLAKAIVSRWRFKIEVVGAAFLLLITIASVVGGVIGSGLKSEVSEFTSRLKSDNEAKLAKDLADMGEAVNAQLTAETAKLNQLIVVSFQQPNIQKTITEVAKTQAETLLKNGVNPQIEEFNKTVAAFTKGAAEREQASAETLNALKIELETVKERNRLTSLADTAISDGDMNAYLAIEKMCIRDPMLASTYTTRAANAEMIRILAAYSSNISRRSGVLYTSKGTPDSLMTVDEIFDTLRKEHLPPQGRHRMAELLESRLTKLTFLQASQLASEIEKESNLLALQKLKKVFSRVPGGPAPYTNPGKDYVLDWWQANRERLEKEMEP